MSCSLCVREGKHCTSLCTGRPSRSDTRALITHHRPHKAHEQVYQRPTHFSSCFSFFFIFLFFYLFYILASFY